MKRKNNQNHNKKPLIKKIWLNFRIRKIIKDQEKMVSSFLKSLFFFLILISASLFVWIIYHFIQNPNMDTTLFIGLLSIGLIGSLGTISYWAKYYQSAKHRKEEKHEFVTSGQQLRNLQDLVKIQEENIEELKNNYSEFMFKKNFAKFSNPKSDFQEQIKFLKKNPTNSLEKYQSNEKIKELIRKFETSFFEKMRNFFQKKCKELKSFFIRFPNYTFLIDVWTNYHIKFIGYYIYNLTLNTSNKLDYKNNNEELISFFFSNPKKNELNIIIWKFFKKKDIWTTDNWISIVDFDYKKEIKQFQLKDKLLLKVDNSGKPKLFNILLNIIFNPDTNSLFQNLNYQTYYVPNEELKILIESLNTIEEINFDEKLVVEFLVNNNDLEFVRFESLLNLLNLETLKNECVKIFSKYRTLSHDFNKEDIEKIEMGIKNQKLQEIEIMFLKLCFYSNQIHLPFHRFDYFYNILSKYPKYENKMSIKDQFENFISKFPNTNIEEDFSKIFQSHCECKFEDQTRKKANCIIFTKFGYEEFFFETYGFPMWQI